MSSTDPTTIGVHRALHEALNSARQARHRPEDGMPSPTWTILWSRHAAGGAVGECDGRQPEMMAKARLARDANT